MKKTNVIIALAVLVGLLATGIYLNYKYVEDTYAEAIAMIQQGSYDEALSLLEKASPDVIDRDDFVFDAKNNRLDKAYKNTVTLYAYSLAQIKYNSENKNLGSVNTYLELIPAEYGGEHSVEIKAFKESFKPQYENFLEEERIKAEERRRLEQERENERIRNSVPYVGMSESRINDTILGTNYELVHNSEYVKGKKIRANVYRFKRGNGIIFVARCLNGKVDSVSDYRDDPWIIRNPSTSKKSTKKADPYNVNEYSDPEDFYYDNYDDFFEYEEAEDYFNEHHD